MKRFMKDDEGWFDEFLNPVILDSEFLGGRAIALHDLNTNESSVFIVKDQADIDQLAYMPTGCVIEVSDYLDTNPPFGLA